MGMIDSTSSNLPEEIRIKQAASIRDALRQAGLFRSEADGTVFAQTDRDTDHGNDLWRISTGPFFLSSTDFHFLESLGQHLLAFYEASNQLYFESLNHRAPLWVADYLNQGKPEVVREYARMKRFKRDLPLVIRPDLIPTDDGMIAAELDAVPGGIGQTAVLSAAYASNPEFSSKLIGGASGILTGFERMIRARSDQGDPLLVIVVSEESKSYRPEMTWLAKALKKRGLRSLVVTPKEVSFSEAGLCVDFEGKSERIDLLYRFFELFDLKNIPKAELMLYAAKKKKVILSPPPKAHLEEKLLFALFHHPHLKQFWQRHLSKETHAVLEKLFPKTWILDPADVPPQALIPGLEIGGNPVSDFRRLGDATKKERQFTIKPSGFSEWAWGSRGVSVGHDMSEADWRKTIDHALGQFPETPYILQQFHKGKKVRVDYADFEKGRCIEMMGRVRLSPYYFVEGKEAYLGGVLATVCSAEKKLIHGMVDAVMAPCAISDD